MTTTVIQSAILPMGVGFHRYPSGNILVTEVHNEPKWNVQEILVPREWSYEVGQAPFIELNVFTGIPNKLKAFRMSKDSETFVVNIRDESGKVVGDITASGIRVIA